MILCLWKGRLRWIGAPLALAVALWPKPMPPDAWIAADGATAAVRSGDAAVLLRTDDIRGFRYSYLNWFWGSYTAVYLGVAVGAYRELIRVVQGRRPEGYAQSLAWHPDVRRHVAELSYDLEAARLMVRRLGWTMDKGEAAGREASQAKYFAAIAARHAADAASEIFGGYALADEYPIRKFTGYIDMLNMGEGAPAVQRTLIAEDTLGYKEDRKSTRLNSSH